MKYTAAEWIADAEHYVRTSCYATQRVSGRPDEWLTDTELAEARTLAPIVVRATRTALSKAGRGNERLGLNSYGRRAASEYADVDELGNAWGQILTYARSVDAAPEQAARLAHLGAEMAGRRDRAAAEALTAAIAREVERRNTDGAWERELERRASIAAGPLVTRI